MGVTGEPDVRRTPGQRAGEWLRRGKKAAAIVMIGALATLLAYWGMIQSGEKARAIACGEAELELEGLPLRLELARDAADLDRLLAKPEPKCVAEVGAAMVRRDRLLVPAYASLIAGMFLMLANLRVVRRLGNGLGGVGRSWWPWLAIGLALAVAAAAADLIENELLLRLLIPLRSPDLDVGETLARLRAATAVKWGALAASAFLAAVLFAWRPLWPNGVEPPRPDDAQPDAERRDRRRARQAALLSLGLSWTAAILGAAAAGLLLYAVLRQDAGIAALRFGGLLLVLFWACVFARALGVAAEPPAKLPVDEIRPEEPETACEAPADAVPPEGSGFERAYPPALWRHEWRSTCDRREKAGLERNGARVGVGCSGGGIRSATLDLGLFQGIAQLGARESDPRRRVLDRIDFLSTVSGGGYFGSFLGRLWTRRFIAGPQTVAEVLREQSGEGRNVLRYLRENGRYLSPNGAGDLMQGGAGVLRSWVSVQLVLLTFLLTVFLGLQVARPALDAAAARLGISLSAGGAFWASPWLLLPVLVFAFLAFPLGWAYWMVEPLRFRGLVDPAAPATEKRRRGSGAYSRDRSDIAPWAGLVLTFVVAAILAGAVQRGIPRAVWSLVALTAAFAFVWWQVAQWVALGKAKEHQQREGGQSLDSQTGALPLPRRRRPGDLDLDSHIHMHSEQRQWLTTWLTRALVASFVLLLLALIDSFGQSLYVALLGPDPWSGWLAGLLSGLGVLAGYGRRIAAFFAKDGKDGRPSLPLTFLATVAALLLVTLILVCVNAASHAVAWRVSAPEGSPEWRHAKNECLKVQRPGGCEPEDLVRASVAREDGFPLRRERDVELSLLGLLAAFVLSVFFGQTFPFVNRSSHQALYSSRLTRAYLGASNLRREGESVTRVIRGDDCDLVRYWPPPAGKAAPIHLINVTVNETVGGRSQVEQKDRKGNNMALGPFGLSLGVEHHAVVPLGEVDPTGRHVRVYPGDETKFRVFEYPRAEGSRHSVFTGEMLSLGEWVGISGAAFSTGLGARTSLGLSLLAGFGNVRLGRWWDSGVDVGARREGVRPKLMARVEHAAARLFPVQIFLLDEFIARFPGTARRHWYLSDGGHFENLAGYELIRRRLPMIVIIDGEQDTEFTFGGLSNLVRKARIDFGAEITFLGRSELEKEVPASLHDVSGVGGVVGTLEELRRDEETRLSRAHAALAWVTYSGRPEWPPSRLLYIKASVTGDEPADVLEYLSSHRDFPHEPTSDQFFDEAQWESYRKLGEHIAHRVFRARHATPEEPAGEAEERARWWPMDLADEPSERSGSAKA